MYNYIILRYVSLSSSAKQRCEMTKFCGIWKSNHNSYCFIFFSNVWPCLRFILMIDLTLSKKVNDFRVLGDWLIEYN